MIDGTDPVDVDITVPEIDDGDHEVIAIRNSDPEANPVAFVV